ncbi:hypothetical protein BFP70_17640 [Thioclava sp. SK-1]|uniref:MOSC domain-containing protein n=1 Tax=Thioclava sp. SK-1 TaxID=1889770 RepID=UPI000824D705|nr:MOSC N-terminal beta barrel domain-containing protein [Thioclava sp. SK-1]OCX60434.1 hypothetical protein BFP70_17640 [Thioclava sp. SK-1]
MIARLDRILRHPIKSIGVEQIESASLSEGRALPFDRVWAVTHAKTKTVAGQWGAKINYVIGRSGPALMQVKAAQQKDGTWRLTHPDHNDLIVDPDHGADQLRLLDWLRALWPETLPQPTGVVRAAAQPLADQETEYLSLIGEGSLQDVSDRAGMALDRDRFRANLWVSGWEAFAEFDLIGRDIRIGQAILRPEKRIGRCRATDADPQTGRRDIDMLKTLNGLYGHTDLGVFCTVIRAGQITRNDQVEIM